MAKTISSLSVALGGTIAPFAKSFGAAGNVVAGFQSKVASAGSTLLKFTGIGGAIAGVLGGAGIAAGVASQMEAIDATAKLADRLGVSTEAYSGLAHAADLSGVAQETLNGGMQKYLKNVADAAAGSASAQQAFSSLGLDANKLANLPTDQAIGMIGDALNNISNPAQRAAAAQEIFGKAGQELLPLLKEGSAGLAGFATEADELGLSFSRVDAAKVEAANDAVSRMKSAAVGVFRTIAVAIAPFVQRFADAGTAIGKRVVAGVKAIVPPVVAWFNKLVAAVMPYIDWIGQAFGFLAPVVGQAVDAIANNLSPILGAIAAVGAMLLGPVVLGAITAIVGVVAGVAAAVMSPIGLVIAAFAAIGAAIGLDRIRAAFATVVKFVQGLLPSIAAVFSAIYTTVAGYVMGVWQSIVGAFNAVYAFVAPIVQQIYQVVAARWQSILTTVVGVGQAVYALVASVFGAVWKIISAVGSAIAAAWSWAMDLLGLSSENAAGKAGSAFDSIVSWAQWLAEGITTGVQIASYLLDHFADVVAFVGLSAAASLVKLANQFAYGFDVAMTYVAWFARNFLNLVLDAFNAVDTITNNGVKNIAAVISNLPGLIAGTTSLEEIWTPLLDTFEATAEKLPTIAARVPGELETALASEANAVGASLAEGLQKHLDDARKAAADTGKGIGDALRKGAENATKPAANLARGVMGAAIDLAKNMPAVEVKTDTKAIDETTAKVAKASDSMKLVVAGSAEAMQLQAQANIEASLGSATAAGQQRPRATSPATSPQAAATAATSAAAAPLPAQAVREMQGASSPAAAGQPPELLLLLRKWYDAWKLQPAIELNEVGE